MLWLQIAIVFLLILLNGFFAMAEMAIISARKARLQHVAEQGHEGARVALELKRDAGRFLSTVQIGITAISVMASVIGGATLADQLDHYLETEPGLLGHYATTISFVIVVFLISYFSLILGELVPKRLALSRPEAIASGLSRFLRLLSKTARPVEWLLNASTDLVLRLVPIRMVEPPPVTEEEITLMLRDAAAEGHFEFTETAIVQMALRLGDLPVNAVMTPRPQIEWLDLGDTAEENRRKIIQSAYSRFPVMDGGPHQVVGIVDVKSVLAAMLGGRLFDLRAAVRSPLYIPSSVATLRALEIFKASGEPMALLVDEFGGLEGLLTLNDIMQSLVGDIASADPRDRPTIVSRDDGSWLVEGMMTLDEVKDLAGINALPGEDDGDFHTLGGFVMARLHRIPRIGDKIMVGKHRFEVMEMDGRRVARVLIVPPKPVAKR